MKHFENRIKEIKSKIKDKDVAHISHCRLWERQYDRYRGIPKAINELRKQGYIVQSEINFGVTDYTIFK